VNKKQEASKAEMLKKEDTQMKLSETPERRQLIEILKLKKNEDIV